MPLVTALGIYFYYIGMNNVKRGMRFDFDGVSVAFHPQPRNLFL